MQVGIDTIEIDRLGEITKDINKLKKMFSENEIEYFNKFTNKLEHIAGFFCAKESFSKALKCGIGDNFNLLDVEVLHEKVGAPYLNIINSDLKNKLKDKKIDISISHSNTIAVATCIIY